MRSDGVSLGAIRRRFSIRFIRALEKISRKGKHLSSINRRRQCYMIKKAAYLSMASAVGPRWAWARALKWRLKHRAHFIIMSRKRKRKRRMLRMRLRETKDDVVGDEPPWTSEVVLLRRLVPGGEEGCMDVCKLLGETAHYIKCLSTQVQVMRSIADHLYNYN